MSEPKKIFVGGVVVIGLAILGANVLTTKSDIPSPIKSKITFPIYYPKGDLGPYAVDKNSFSIITDPQDSKQSILSFVITGAGNKITLTEQLTPDLVTDQGGLDKLASLMQVYKEIVTSAGRIELTHPKELHGGQTVVADPNFTTLIFARPEKDVSGDDWRKIFNSLEIVR